HVTGQRAAGSLDLARGDAIGLDGLEAILAERQRRTRSRGAVDAALVRLPELRFLGLHHGVEPSNLHFASGRGGVAAGTSAFALGHFLVLCHWIVLEDLALEDPDLDAAGAECRE